MASNETQAQQVTGTVVASTDDRDFLQRGARSLRRIGIQTLLVKTDDNPLPAWSLVATTSDRFRATAAFKDYVDRVNARNAGQAAKGS